jgi:hypothetical protein
MMKNEPKIRPLTDDNYEEILNERYIDVPNKAFKATPKTEDNLDTDFSTCSNDFWLSHEGGKYFTSYNEGYLNGTYNARRPTFTSIIETFMEALKNILRLQCDKEDKTTEEFNDHIRLIEHSFKLLIGQLHTSLEKEVDGELVIAYLHATFNSFINTNIKSKEK